MSVDSFKYLPRLISEFYKSSQREPKYPIPWTPLTRPISQSKFGLITSGGLFHKGLEHPFDMKREKHEPTWGDPTYRNIPSNIKQSDVGASHLHINTQDVLDDINILLPIGRFKELEKDGLIGGLAQTAYSFMGYQGFPPDTSKWEEVYGPEVAERFKEEEVDCVFLTPA